MISSSIFSRESFTFKSAFTAWASNLKADGVGNGGDYLSSEFIARGHKIYDYLRKGNLILSREDLQEFADALPNTPVESTDEPLYDHNHIQVDARTIDNPNGLGKMIQLYRPRWTDYHIRQSNVYKLVFHEYLWVLGLDDTNYRISNNLKLADGDLPLLRGLPQGIYRGTGSWSNDLKQSGFYSTVTNITGNRIVSQFSSPGLTIPYATTWRFGAQGYFELFADSIATAVGNGTCNDVQCIYTVPNYYETSEIWTFFGDHLQRGGTRIFNGIRAYWFENLKKD